MIPARRHARRPVCLSRTNRSGTRSLSVDGPCSSGFPGNPGRSGLSEGCASGDNLSGRAASAGGPRTAGRPQPWGALTLGDPLLGVRITWRKARDNADLGRADRTADERRVPCRDASHHGQHRAGHRRQERDGATGPRGAAGRGAPADRGRAGRRQDETREGARPIDRLLRAPDPVHPGFVAQRCHRGERLQPGDPGLRVQAGCRLRQPGGRRRDQPSLAEDPVRSPGVHGGTTGHRRRHHLRAAGPVHGGRDAEPDRDGGDLSAARGAARPVHRPDRDGLPGSARRAGDADRQRRPRPAERPARGRRRHDDPPADRDGPRGARRRRRPAVCDRPGHRDP